MAEPYLTALNDVYRDRNLLAQLAAELARQLGLHVGIGHDRSEPDWPLIYIDLPTGQISWHIPKSECVIGLDQYDQPWDGHSVGEKQRRIQQFLSRTLPAGE